MRLKAVNTVETITDGHRESHRPGKVFTINDENVGDALVLAGAAIRADAEVSIVAPFVETTITPVVQAPIVPVVETPITTTADLSRKARRAAQEAAIVTGDTGETEA